MPGRFDFILINEDEEDYEFEDDDVLED